MTLLRREIERYRDRVQREQVQQGRHRELVDAVERMSAVTGVGLDRIAESSADVAGRTASIAADVGVLAAVVDASLPAIVSGLAASAERLGNIETALNNPSATAAAEMYRRGSYALASGWLEEAAADLTRSVETFPYMAEAWFNLGTCRYRQGDADKTLAAEAFMRCVRYSMPRTPVLAAGGVLVAAAIYRELGAIERSQEVLAELAGRIDACAEIHLALAVHHSQQAGLRRALELAPHLAEDARAGKLTFADTVAADLCRDGRGLVARMRVLTAACDSLAGEAVSAGLNNVAVPQAPIRVGATHVELVAANGATDSATTRVAFGVDALLLANAARAPLIEVGRRLVAAVHSALLDADRAAGVASREAQLRQREAGVAKRRADSVEAALPARSQAALDQVEPAVDKAEREAARMAAAVAAEAAAVLDAAEEAVLRSDRNVALREMELQAHHRRVEEFAHQHRRAERTAARLARTQAIARRDLDGQLTTAQVREADHAARSRTALSRVIAEYAQAPPSVLPAAYDPHAERRRHRTSLARQWMWDTPVPDTAERARAELARFGEEFRVNPVDPLRDWDLKAAPHFEQAIHDVRAAEEAARHRADLATRLADLDLENARESADDDRNRAIGEQHHRTTMADLLHRAQRATAEFAERLEQARDQVDQAHRELDDARLNLARTTDNVDTAARTAVATARSDAESLAAQQIDELRNERAAARAAADQSQHTAAEEQRRAITAAAAADHARQQVAPALAAVETAIADLTPPHRIIPFSHPGQLEPLPLDD
ncbi:hypothetical protein [Virgisporangium aurantiacum]|uniref:Tetratricopeptide repeat-containing protein n=1 Tax=Virgisporangium aurantiacum TaxID=175570 RepID=A0A8J4E3K6_9ACTN|nr:hypothetical protein [Virgisporangium aurantiacum]GIJ60043.1 hypothetical protein Vau01_075590 [Virgisporangium aurantiacum]